MLELTLPVILAGILALALNAYVLLGGADFGGGVWDMLASGPRRDRQRALVAQAIGPIWEANHVWLILAVVLLFTCFPAVFAQLAITLHIPLTLMLIGIVLRGSAFTFRTYDSQQDEVQRRWGTVFSSASVLTPILLGVSIGAVASGRVPAATGSSFFASYLHPWLNPFALSVGLLALTLFAFLAAVYLTVETSGDELCEDFRGKALGAGVAVFAAAGLVLVLSFRDAPLMRSGLMASPWAVPLHLLTATTAITAFLALWLRRWRVARVAAAAQVSLILWGWLFAQYPYLLPPHITITSAAAPGVTLKLVLIGLGFGALLLAPSLYYLFRVFKGKNGASIAMNDRKSR